MKDKYDRFHGDRSVNSKSRCFSYSSWLFLHPLNWWRKWKAVGEGNWTGSGIPSSRNSLFLFVRFYLYGFCFSLLCNRWFLLVVRGWKDDRVLKRPRFEIQTDTTLLLLRRQILCSCKFCVHRMFSLPFNQRNSCCWLTIQKQLFSRNSGYFLLQCNYNRRKKCHDRNPMNISSI